MTGAAGPIVLLISLCSVLAADVSYVCPAFDPSNCPVARPIPAQCDNDTQCRAGMKCCCQNCGWQCVEPVEVRPGRCPPIKIKCEKLTYDCKSDIDCLDPMKCCDICGKTCQKPFQEPGGVCPKDDGKEPVQCPSIQCSRDSDCNVNEICCVSGEGQQCVTPVFPDVNYVCPAFDPSICAFARPVPAQCDIVRQCPRGKKCCCQNCGWQCVDPVEVRPGRCPPMISKCEKLTYECKNDSDCLDPMKCCDICGKTCQKPSSEPGGVCPKNDGKPAQCPSVQCSRDSDCNEKEICCVSGEGQKCVTPVFPAK